jgi:predicted MFS family arabinose efflux permease
MGTGAVGSYLALLIGVGGALGIYMGGRIADGLARIWGPQWLPWVIAIASIFTIPMLYLAFVAETASAAIWAYAIPAALGTVYVAPGFALIQNETPLHMRSVAAAINLFVINIIGLGLGPFTVGFLSDQFVPAYGEDSLRYALMCTLVIIIWSIFHYYRAGVLLRRRASESVAAT